MNPAMKKRKLAVSQINEAMSKFIKGLNLGTGKENELFKVVIDHVDAVRRDAYADGAGDMKELVKSVKVANEIIETLK